MFSTQAIEIFSSSRCLKRKAFERRSGRQKKSENCEPLRASQHNNLLLQAREHNFHLSKRFSNRTIYGIVGLAMDSQWTWNGMAEANKARESLEVEIINEIIDFYCCLVMATTSTEFRTC